MGWLQLCWINSGLYGTSTESPNSQVPRSEFLGDVAVYWRDLVRSAFAQAASRYDVTVLHQKFENVVRIDPNEVWIDDSDAVKDLCRHGNHIEKTSHYWAFVRSMGHVFSLVHLLFVSTDRTEESPSGKETKNVSALILAATHRSNGRMRVNGNLQIPSPNRPSHHNMKPNKHQRPESLACLQ